MASKKEQTSKRKRRTGRRRVRTPFTDAVAWVRWNVVSEVLPLIAILAIAGVLRFASLGTKSLWFDEVRSYYDARDAFYLLHRTHTWAFKAMNLALRLGRDWDFLLRLPSAVAGVLSVLFVYLAARITFRRTTALIAALLVAVSAYSIWYSQEARYYALMMCLAACSLYFTVLLLERKYLWSFLVLGLLGYASYQVHPTTLVFTSAELSFVIFWFLISRGAREKVMRPIRAALERRKYFQLAAAGILGLAFVFEFYRLAGGRIVHTLLGVLRGEIVIGETGVPEVGVSWAFLYRHVQRFGTMGLRSDWFAMLVHNLAGFSFLAGVVLLFFKKRALALFLIYVPATTLLALLTFPSHQTYAVKYVSFLFPLYVFGIAHFFGEIPFLFSRRQLAPAPGERFVPWVIALLFIAAFTLANVQSLIKYYPGERMNYKGAVRDFVWKSKNAALLGAYGKRYNMLTLDAIVEPGDAILAGYGLSHYSANYYFDYFGLPKENIVELPQMRGTGVGAINRLRQLCARHRSVWFVTGWNEDQPQELLTWVNKNFDAMKRFPQLPAMYCSMVRLYRSRYPGCYVAYPHSYSAWVDQGGKLYQPTEVEAKRGAAGGYKISRAGFRQTLFFDATSSYVISLKAASRREKGVTLAVLLDGKQIGVARIMGGGPAHEAPFNASASSGAHEIALVPQAAVGSEELDVRIMEVRVEPDFTQGARFEAEDFSTAQPTYVNSTGGFRGREAFVMPLNSYVGYDIRLPQNGSYILGVEANNDKPGPVLIEVTLDEKPVAFLIFRGRDNKWGMQYFPFEATAGAHRLVFSFVSHYQHKNIKGDDGENICALDFFTITRISPGLSTIRDDRYRLMPLIHKFRQEQFYPFEDPKKPGFANEHWTLAKGHCVCVLDRQEMRGAEKPLRLEIPYDSGPVVLGSMLGDVKMGEFVYFSVKIKTKDLYNHSASAVLQVFDKDDKMVKLDWATEEGLTGTRDWQRQVYCDVIPQNAAQALLTLAVYPNNTMISKKTGYVWFDDLRMENPPK
jgi:hypothetical protein